ncbi:MerR family transcriptional regulator [Pseudonocardia abyssalis]|jgi:DNA-binding transcriptional MerR regulator|uniref:MerR family transcriptional regulator n=1 Tax=Pseudonocardia abyssalis TaxID=2792008 RepID=A0ABS6USX4_9PSEU|nr:MerR family transcriptional regulator [Pseudonocardia abyssalis]MBW0114545.1 MerR family transcriptional regulator [Pseudonocardia abyssalis]MBW0135056.1 MerR family transcriptional regulator [Pseudonocardia abyssalis]MDN5930447.1 MerR family transcriptional regulator [Pseudonocardia sp.]
MRIGEVSDRVGLSLRTIRHWGEIGLVVPSDRSPGGFRFYSEADVAKLELVKALRPLELSLDQIRELVETMDAAAVAADPDEVGPIAARLAMYRALAESRVETLRAQIQGLERLSREMRTIEGDARHRAR